MNPSAFAVQTYSQRELGGLLGASPALSLHRASPQATIEGPWALA
jgi:hypothetical protein